MPCEKGRVLPAAHADPNDWRKIRAERVPLCGHRSWIAVVDVAYPAQTHGGMQDGRYGCREELHRGERQAMARSFLAAALSTTARAGHWTVPPLAPEHLPAAFTAAEG